MSIETYRNSLEKYFLLTYITYQTKYLLLIFQRKVLILNYNFSSQFDQSFLCFIISIVILVHSTSERMVIDIDLAVIKLIILPLIW